MSRFKLIAFIALITLAFGVALISDALAGEKVKFRTSIYRVKVEAVPVGDEEGHVVVVYEDKGISTNLEGKKFLDGWAFRQAGLSDANRNAGAWSAQGYGEFTDPDGDRIYVAYEGKKLQKDLPGEGTVRLIKGTGKWQGIQGEGTWVCPLVVEDRWYADWELDVELPR